MSGHESDQEAHRCQPSRLGMSCLLWLCAFLRSPGSQNSCNSSGSSRCLPATGGDPSVCTSELIHPPWPAKVFGLSLHHFRWENLGRQLPRTNSQLPSGIYYLGRGIGMENTGKGTAARAAGGMGELSRRASCSAADACGSVPMGKASLGWKRPFLQGWRGYQVEDAGWGLGGQRDATPLLPLRLPPAACCRNISSCSHGPEDAL